MHDTLSLVSEPAPDLTAGGLGDRPFFDREAHDTSCCESCRDRLFRIEQAIGAVLEELTEIRPVTQALAAFDVESMPPMVRKLFGLG